MRLENGLEITRDSGDWIAEDEHKTIRFDNLYYLVEYLADVGVLDYAWYNANPTMNNSCETLAFISPDNPIQREGDDEPNLVDAIERVEREVFLKYDELKSSEQIGLGGTTDLALMMDELSKMKENAKRDE